MERYCCTKGQYGERFNDANEDGAFFRAIFVWGVRPRDDGDPFDPDDKGKIHYREFDMYSTTSQQYLYDFCENARASSWYTSTPGDHSDNCPMQAMIVSRRPVCFVLCGCCCVCVWMTEHRTCVCVPSAHTTLVLHDGVVR